MFVLLQTRHSPHIARPRSRRWAQMTWEPPAWVAQFSLLTPYLQETWPKLVTNSTCCTWTVSIPPWPFLFPHNVLFIFSSDNSSQFSVEVMCHVTPYTTSSNAYLRFSVTYLKSFLNFRSFHDLFFLNFIVTFTFFKILVEMQPLMHSLSTRGARPAVLDWLFEPQLGH